MKLDSLKGLKEDGLGVKWAIPKAQTRRLSDNKVDSPRDGSGRFERMKVDAHCKSTTLNYKIID